MLWSKIWVIHRKVASLNHKDQFIIRRLILGIIYLIHTLKYVFKASKRILACLKEYYLKFYFTLCTVFIFRGKNHIKTGIFI